MERESTSFPEWAWPQPGDHLQALGSWVWDCDHYQGRGEKTEFHPFRAAWIVRAASPRAARLSSEGDLFVSTDATPAGREAECAHQTKGSDQFKSCSHASPDWLSVNGAYAFDLPAPTASCVAAGAPNGRPRQLQRASDRRDVDGQGLARLLLGRGCGGRACARRPPVVRDLPERSHDRPSAPALRPAARAACDGPELPARQAGVPVRERVDASRSDRERPGRVAADVERRRDLGPLARDARREGRLDVRGQAERRLLSSSAGSPGRSWRSPANATSARSRAGTGRAIRRRRARSRTRSATPQETTIRARSRSPIAARARPARLERDHRRLDLPAVERERVLPAHLHG